MLHMWFHISQFKCVKSVKVAPRRTLFRKPSFWEWTAALSYTFQSWQSKLWYQEVTQDLEIIDRKNNFVVELKKLKQIKWQRAEHDTRSSHELCSLTYMSFITHSPSYLYMKSWASWQAILSLEFMFGKAEI